ncbi:protease HtpX [Candidatus Gracilibacteria bacterium]|nr:protease HtpX [Candidatus Gracilibacteria bacterium]
MNLIKRIGLFLLTNIAVIFLFSIIIFLIERIFGINISASAGTGYTGLLIYAAIFGFVGSFFSLAISRWSAKKLYSITPIKADEVSFLSPKEQLVYRTVHDISQRENIKAPQVGIYQSQDPNAFATGATKNSSLVACSSGLLQSMTEDEIEAVVAHEMAHVVNGDMVTMSLLQGVMNTFVIFFARIIANIINERTEGKLGGVVYFAVYIVLQIVLGILASLVVNAFSRRREFHADAGSAKFVGKEKMIAALQALGRMKELAPSNADKLATMKINTKTDTGFKKFFMTHPPIEERIKNLENLRIS